MKKAMLFSGGFDSTYLLNYLMKHEDELTILSIKSNVLSKGKVIREENARKRILDYLKAKYYNCKLTELEVEVNFNHTESSGLAQPLMWLPFMYLLVSDEYELNLSYICDDQAIIHMADFKTILETASHFQTDKSKVIVKFPLRYFYKRDIVMRLIHQDKFLFENATSCENIDDEDFCGECVPCKCLRSTLIDLICDNEVSDEDKDYCRKYLADKFNTKITCEPYTQETINLVEENEEERIESKQIKRKKDENECNK